MSKYNTWVVLMYITYHSFIPGWMSNGRKLKCIFGLQFLYICIVVLAILTAYKHLHNAQTTERLFILCDTCSYYLSVDKLQHMCKCIEYCIRKTVTVFWILFLEFPITFIWYSTRSMMEILWYFITTFSEILQIQLDLI